MGYDRTTSRWQAARRALRGSWGGLASCLMSPLLGAVCFFVTLNGVPVGWLLHSQTEAEAAAGEACDEVLGVAVDLFGRPRRCPTSEVEPPTCSVTPLVLATGIDFRAHGLNRDGGWPALPLFLNGCGAVLRC
jgi:hypothetical protein